MKDQIDLLTYSKFSPSCCPSLFYLLVAYVIILTNLYFQPGGNRWFIDTSPYEMYFYHFFLNILSIISSSTTWKCYIFDPFRVSSLYINSVLNKSLQTFFKFLFICIFHHVFNTLFVNLNRTFLHIQLFLNEVS